MSADEANSLKLSCWKRLRSGYLFTHVYLFHLTFIVPGLVDLWNIQKSVIIDSYEIYLKWKVFYVK